MILMKDIIREGNVVLRTKCEEVPIPLSPEDEQTIKDMIEYLFQSQDIRIHSTCQTSNSGNLYL